MTARIGKARMSVLPDMQIFRNGTGAVNEALLDRPGPTWPDTRLYAPSWRTCMKG